MRILLDKDDLRPENQTLEVTRIQFKHLNEAAKIAIILSKSACFIQDRSYEVPLVKEISIPKMFQ
jgi:hypothetical protein